MASSVNSALIRTGITQQPAPPQAAVNSLYRRDGSDRFVTATLVVKALPGGKIYFDVDATNGGNTGEADGTVPLRNHLAVYKLDTSELRLQFEGKRARCG